MSFHVRVLDLGGAPARAEAALVEREDGVPTLFSHDWNDAGSVVRLPPQPWLCMMTGTGCLRVAYAGRNSVKQICTGAVVPGSGTLVMHPLVVRGPAEPTARAGAVAVSEAVAAEGCHGEVRAGQASGGHDSPTPERP